MDKYKKLILFGAGNFGKIWLKKIGKDKVYAFSDFNKDKIGSYVEGKKVLSVNELVEMKNEICIYITTSSTYIKEIKEKLTEYNLAKCIKDNFITENESYLDTNAEITDTVLEGNNSIWGNTKVYGSTIGYGSYIGENGYICNTKIGRFSSIGQGFNIVAGQHPTEKYVSTYPAFYSKDNVSILFSYVQDNIFEEHRYSEYPYYVNIGNDVWIGANVSIMEGVSIADGTIIGAGANVTRSTEPYSIIVGNPARCIRYRFDKDEIDFLVNLQWWNKPQAWIEKNAVLFKDIKELKKHIENEIDI